MRNAKRLPLEQLAPFLVDDPDEPIPLDGPRIFGNERPVEIEVGFGKGWFLVSAAQACPQTNFLGIEIMRKFQLYVAGRLVRNKLTNARVARADARIFLRDHLPTSSVQAMHVYFPDPWWKKRHYKRRLFTAEFAAECGRVLQPGGLLHVVTDVADYFVVIRALLAERPELALEPVPEPGAPEHDLDYLTNFERKYRKEGRPIHRGCYRRREST
ncbi:MAG: tRNA (guanosine(46)-N7)-methyltransferase TrmB [Gemmataceae bacterium]